MSVQFVWCIRYSKWHGTLGLLEGSDSHSVSSPVQIEAIWNCVWLQSELVSKKANWQPKGSLNLCRAQLSGDKVGGLVME